MFNKIRRRIKPPHPTQDEDDFSVGRGERKTRGNTTIAISKSGRSASIDIDNSTLDEQTETAIDALIKKAR